MDEHQAIYVINPCLQLAAAGAMDGGPWTDQEWMHDRAAVRPQCLTLFPLAPSLHVVRVQLHERRPDFDGPESDAHWAHAVEASWTPGPETMLSAQGATAKLVLPEAPCRFCWRLGWFDPETMKDAPRWGALRAELHVWPAPAAAVEVRKLWDGESPDLPEPPTQRLNRIEILTACVILTLLFVLLALIPLGVLVLFWQLAKLLFRQLGLVGS